VHNSDRGIENLVIFLRIVSKGDEHFCSAGRRRRNLKLALYEEITDHQFPVSFHCKNHGFCLMKRNGTERISIASIFDIEESSIFGNCVGDILNSELDI
jgi:hypothetical protein